MPMCVLVWLTWFGSNRPREKNQSLPCAHWRGHTTHSTVRTPPQLPPRAVGFADLRATPLASQGTLVQLPQSMVRMPPQLPPHRSQCSPYHLALVTAYRRQRNYRDNREKPHKNCIKKFNSNNRRFRGFTTVTARFAAITMIFARLSPTVKNTHWKKIEKYG